MENSTKETVIIVHGTWAAPKDDQQPDQLCWYQIPAEGQNKPNFVSKLNEALEKRGSTARCWAHCKDNSEIFTWSGENAWIDRTRAASSLAAKINELQADGWRCHVVAHSHGGNVIAEALPAIVPTGDQPYGVSGTITTLGTPFIDAMSPIAERIARRRQVFNILAWSLYWPATIYFIAMSLDIMNYHVRTSMTFYQYSWLIFFPVVSIISIVGLLVYFLKHEQTTLGWREYWKEHVTKNCFRPFILCISSPMDEAWQLLHHIRSIQNPLAPRSGFIAYFRESRKAYVHRSYEVVRILGISVFSEQPVPIQIMVVLMWLLVILFAAIIKLMVIDKQFLFVFGANLILVFIWFGIATVITFFFSRSFYSALFAPVRWLSRQAWAISRIFNDFGTYVARRRSWSLLQEIAFGLEGYSFELPQAESEPTFAPKAIYKHEPLPSKAEARALSSREEWAKKAFGDVTKMLSEMASPDLSSLMRMVETNLSLVHAAYYTDDECIEMIADWIAGKAPETATGDAKLLGTDTEYGTAASHSALGHEQTSRHVRVMSVIPPQSGHSSARFARPLCANNGHSQSSRSSG